MKNLKRVDFSMSPATLPGRYTVTFTSEYGYKHVGYTDNTHLYDDWKSGEWDGQYEFSWYESEQELFETLLDIVGAEEATDRRGRRMLFLPNESMQQTLKDGEYRLFVRVIYKSNGRQDMLPLTDIIV